MTTNETMPPASAAVPPPGWDIPPRAESATQPARKPRWSGRKTALAVVAAVAVAGAATAGIAVAANHTSAGTGGSGQFGGPPGQGGFPGGPGGQQGLQGQQDGGLPGGRGGPAGGLAGALHGQFVVADGNGGYVTREVQTGKVTAVSATSITVVSTDGYSRTYTVDSSTAVDNGADAISDVATGHTANVIATVSGGNATANQITDRDLLLRNGGSGAGQQGATAPRSTT
jgi:hypothetical protein